MPKNPFVHFDLEASCQQLDHARRILQELNQMMDEDFWNTLSGLAGETFGLRQQVRQASRPPKAAGSVPAEIWEADRQIYLLLGVPGIKDRQDVRITFRDEQTLQVEAPPPRLQPVTASILLNSEFPKGTVVREIHLPCPVSAKSYSISCKNGILTIVLNKAEEREAEPGE